MSGNHLYPGVDDREQAFNMPFGGKGLIDGHDPNHSRIVPNEAESEERKRDRLKSWISGAIHKSNTPAYEHAVVDRDTQTAEPPNSYYRGTSKGVGGSIENPDVEEDSMVMQSVNDFSGHPATSSRHNGPPMTSQYNQYSRECHENDSPNYDNEVKTRFDRDNMKDLKSKREQVQGIMDAYTALNFKNRTIVNLQKKLKDVITKNNHHEKALYRFVKDLDSWVAQCGINDNSDVRIAIKNISTMLEAHTAFESNMAAGLKKIYEKLTVAGSRETEFNNVQKKHHMGKKKYDQAVLKRNSKGDGTIHALLEFVGDTQTRLTEERARFESSVTLDFREIFIEFTQQVYNSTKNLEDVSKKYVEKSIMELSHIDERRTVEVLTKSMNMRNVQGIGIETSGNRVHRTLEGGVFDIKDPLLGNVYKKLEYLIEAPPLPSSAEPRLNFKTVSEDTSSFDSAKNNDDEGIETILHDQQGVDLSKMHIREECNNTIRNNVLEEKAVDRDILREKKMNESIAVHQKSLEPKINGGYPSNVVDQRIDDFIDSEIGHAVFQNFDTHGTLGTASLKENGWRSAMLDEDDQITDI